jgi:hypothetical protein
MKPTVSPKTKADVLKLRQRQSLSEVARLTGLPIGTVKTICSRSGQFRDNLIHRTFFTLPPIRESESTALSVPELPPQQIVTGDTEVDAILWLQQVVSTGQPALIEKAMQARKRIKTPIKELEKRYSDFLMSKAKSPGDAFGIAFATIGFGELDEKAEHAVRCNTLAHEALARFGSETWVFTNTPAEDFIVAALAGIRYEGKCGFPELTPKVIEAFRTHPDYLPHTLSDCLHEFAYWRDLYQLRHAVSNNAGDGLHEEWVRRDFLFLLLSQIRARSKDEALAVLHWMHEDEAMDRDGADDVLRNLVGGSV